MYVCMKQCLENIGEGLLHMHVFLVNINKYVIIPQLSSAKVNLIIRLISTLINR